MKWFSSANGPMPRIAVIGCGAVAERCHIPALNRLGMRPTIVIDVDRDRAERVAKECGAEASTDYLDAAAHADAAVVSVPSRLHCSVSCDLLAMGMHVLVEKPLAMSTVECDRMIEAAAIAGRVLEVGLMRRHLSSCAWLAAMMKSGRLGPVNTFHLSEGFRFSWPVLSASFFQPSSGGVLFDTGPHALDLIAWLFDEVHVTGYSDDNAGGVEADCVVELVAGSGTTGVVELSRTRDLRNTLVLETDVGVVEIGLYGDKLVLPGALQGLPMDGPWGRRWRRQSIDNLFDVQLTRWIAAVTGAAPVAVGALAARSSIKLLEECAPLRRPIRLPWIGGHRDQVVSADLSHGTGGETVLVTGAGGFIGSRVVERLVGQGLTVRAMVHAFGGAARIGRFDLEIIQGDIADPEDMRRAVHGCHSVVHCAYDSARPQANQLAAATLAKACIDGQVEQIVHLSSLSVYEPLTGASVTESSPRVPAGWAYADAKLETELEILRWHQEHGLPVVVLQPTIVYGPFSAAWTTRIVEMLRKNHVVLPDDGQGVCNAVYIDDVVSAITLALRARHAVGELLLITGPETVTWRRFFEAYEEHIDVRPKVFVSSDELSAMHTAPSPRQQLVGAFRNPGAMVKSVVPAQSLTRVKAALGPERMRRLKEALPTPYAYPDPQALALYRSRATVDGSRARRVLGFSPNFSFDAGMEITATFLRWADL